VSTFRKRTRMVKATELLDRLNRGPQFSLSPVTSDYGIALPPSTRALVEQDVLNQYRSWIDSWVRQDVLDLIPELRGAKDD